MSQLSWKMVGLAAMIAGGALAATSEAAPALALSGTTLSNASQSGQINGQVLAVQDDKKFKSNQAQRPPQFNRSSPPKLQPSPQVKEFKPGQAERPPQFNRSSPPKLQPSPRVKKFKPGQVERSPQFNRSSPPKLQMSPQVKKFKPKPNKPQIRQEYKNNKQHKKWSGHGHRYRHKRHGYSYYYGGYWYATPWWTFPIQEPYYNDEDAHVDWCRRHYRSYNPVTDMYLGYDGKYHRCRSPYRP